MKTRLLQISLASTALLTLMAPPGQRALHAQSRVPAGYVITDLGTLGGANSFAYSINGSGLIAGGSNVAGQNDLFAQTAFLWAGGPLVALGTLGGSACPDCSSQGAAVRADGSVVILSETGSADPNGEDFCEFGTHRQCLAALWRNGELTPLPTLTGGTSGNSEAFFANKYGEMVGVSETATPDATCATPFQVRQFEAVKWARDGSLTALPPLADQGDTVSFAFTNNDNGEVVGFSGLCSNVVLPPFLPPSAPHAVMWDASGVAHDLGNPDGGAGDNVAVGINNHDQITINSVMLDGTVHAFVWSDGRRTQLATYPSDAFQTVTPCCNNINDSGQIVGFSVDSSFTQRALLWANKDAAPVDLNTFLPNGSPWVLGAPGGINAKGEIAVTGVNVNTLEMHAFLLSPINGTR